MMCYLIYTAISPICGYNNVMGTKGNSIHILYVNPMREFKDILFIFPPFLLLSFVLTNSYSSKCSIRFEMSLAVGNAFSGEFSTSKQEQLDEILAECIHVDSAQLYTCSFSVLESVSSHLRAASRMCLNS